MHNDLGVTYYQRNDQYDRQRARDEFNEAVLIDPDYDVARNNLAGL
jgi:Flp pilus assembly protein TadD